MKIYLSLNPLYKEIYIFFHFYVVEQLLQESSYIPPQKSAAAVTDLRCLCTALLEALNDKTLALAHQKKANK